MTLRTRALFKTTALTILFSPMILVVILLAACHGFYTSGREMFHKYAVNARRIFLDEVDYLAYQQAKNAEFDKMEEEFWNAQ